jgi:hypothetical protein
MILYTTIPAVVNNLIVRLRIAAVGDSKTNIVASLDAIGTMTWYNLIFRLNALKDVIKLFQVYLLDGELQDFIDEIGIVAFYDLFHKVAVLIEATELIESLTE